MKLSIITINYNNKAGLEKTIASVMAQKPHPQPISKGRGEPFDFEWIIIDGGSTDGSKEVIENLAKNPDANISYWCSEPDKGIYNAMNKGIAHANGEYLQFLNSGDAFFDESTLQMVFEKEYTADILYGDWTKVYDDHEDIVHAPTEVGICFFYNWNICQQAMFVRTELLKQKSFDESYKLYADWQRWIDATLDGVVFQHVGRIICRYEAGGISDSSEDLWEVESERIHESYPSTIKQVLEEYESIRQEYLDNPYILKTKEISDKGGIKWFIHRSFLRLLGGKLHFYDKKPRVVSRIDKV